MRLKNTRLFVNLAIVSLLILSVAFSIGTLVDKSREPEQQIAQSEAFTQAIVNGKLVATIAAVQATQKQIQASTDQRIRELVQGLGKHDKLISATSASWVSEGKQTVPIRDTLYVFHNTITNTTDTLRAGTFTFNDGFLAANGLIQHDSVELQYSYKSDVRLLTYWQSKGWFKPPTLMAKLINDNPNAHVTSLVNYAIVQPRPAWHKTRGAAFAAGMLVGAGGAVGLAMATR